VTNDYTGPYRDWEGDSTDLHLTLGQMERDGLLSIPDIPGAHDRASSYLYDSRWLKALTFHWDRRLKNKKAEQQLTDLLTKALAKYDVPAGLPAEIAARARDAGLLRPTDAPRGL
jgi:hypothetical protein